MGIIVLGVTAPVFIFVLYIYIYLYVGFHLYYDNVLEHEWNTLVFYYYTGALGASVLHIGEFLSRNLI